MSFSIYVNGGGSNTASGVPFSSDKGRTHKDKTSHQPQNMETPEQCHPVKGEHQLPPLQASSSRFVIIPDHMMFVLSEFESVYLSTDNVVMVVLRGKAAGLHCNSYREAIELLNCVMAQLSRAEHEGALSTPNHNPDSMETVQNPRPSGDGGKQPKNYCRFRHYLRPT